MLGLIGVAMTPTEVLGQCEAEWLPGLAGAGGLTKHVHAFTLHDPDGNGPQREMVILGGDFGRVGVMDASQVAGWDGTSWLSFGDGLGPRFGSQRVNALESFDPDGDGPAPPQIIAAGSFSTSGEEPINQIASWDGSEWQQLGGGLPGVVTSLQVFDADGSGPGGPKLIAGGTFSVAGGPTESIASWDGQTWSSLGFGRSFNIRALTVFDADGTGPLPEVLVVAGAFGSAGGNPARNIAAWNGSSWEPFGDGLFPASRAVTSWDPDGAGPLNPLLISADEGGRVFAWDGQRWAQMGTTGLNTAFSLAVLQESPNQPGVLMAGGSNEVVRWNGTEWDRVADRLGHNVFAITPFDPDGIGVDQLLVGGDFVFLGGGVAGPYVTTLVNGEWGTVGRGFNNSVSSMILHDFGSSNGERALVVGGWFSVHDNKPLNRIAKWDGEDWTDLGSGLNNNVKVLLSHDFDGSGGDPARLIAGGNFMASGGIPFENVASWDGVNWRPVGSGLGGSLYTLSQFDFDGTGPEPSSLVASGYGILPPGGPSTRVAKWNGSDWVPVGGHFNNWVEILTTIDFDGDGPNPPTLVAGGNFSHAGGVLVNKVTQWDGVGWQPIGEGIPSGWTSTLFGWDRDGDGPGVPLLVAGGVFEASGGVAPNYIAIWDGVSWEGLGGGMNGRVAGLGSFDPDGSGPAPADLIAVGTFSMAGGVPANNIARWDGANWHAMDEGLGNRGTSVMQVDETGPQGMRLNLLVAGQFEFAGGQPSAYFAQYGCPPCPADCDQSTGVGVLDIFDFLCFQDAFVAGCP